MSNFTSPIEFSMNTELSLGIEITTPAGSRVCNCSISVLTAWAVATMLAPDCLRTCNATADCPLSDAWDRFSAAPSTRRATSRTRTGAPSTLVITMSPSSSIEAT